MKMPFLAINRTIKCTYFFSCKLVAGFYSFQFKHYKFDFKCICIHLKLWIFQKVQKNKCNIQHQTLKMNSVTIFIRFYCPFLIKTEK